MHGAVEAAFWGLVSGSALLLGAAIGWFCDLPQRIVAAIMAFGSGVLISALSFDLMDEAWRHGGILPAALGFLGGASLFTIANLAVARIGGKHRKRARVATGGAALAVGALLDGIPEALVIGVSLLDGTGVSLVAVGAVFLSNIPEGLSSAAGMKQAGHGLGFVALLWSGIALITAAAAAAGYLLFDGAAPATVAVVMAFAAGAILAMIVDTMVPEAFEGTHDFAGMIAVAGFLLAFAMSKSVG